MIRFLFQRLAVLLFRLVFGTLVIAFLIEAGYGILGGNGRHIWTLDWNQPVPDLVEPRAEGWGALFRERLAASSMVVALAWGGALLVGYSWGVLGARLRRFYLVPILTAPFAALACLPGFWIVVAVAVYSYSHWQRPGFADDLAVESGPDILLWWNAGVVALPLFALAASWQIRAVASAVGEEASRPFVKGLFLAGYRDEDIFHGNVMKRSLPGLAGLIDGSLGAIVGGLLIVEPAFHFNGIGSMLADSIRSAAYPGIILSASGMVLVATVAATIRECLVSCVRTEE